MAGQEIAVDMRGEDLVPAWSTVLELPHVAADWTIVGGLMVLAHARRAGVDMIRPTDDVDVLVDYLADRSILGQTRAQLEQVGFHLNDVERYAYRFVHTDGRKVDLMIADHLPSRMRPRMGGRPAFSVPAGQQAINRRDHYHLHFAEGRSVVVGVPDELGALVAKSAAWSVDSRDRNRHLDDAAVLLASITDLGGLFSSKLSLNDRRRLRTLEAQLADPTHSAWANLQASDRDRAQFNLALIESQVS